MAVTEGREVERVVKGKGSQTHGDGRRLDLEWWTLTAVYTGCVIESCI